MFGNAHLAIPAADHAERGETARLRGGRGGIDEVVGLPSADWLAAEHGC